MGINPATAGLIMKGGGALADIYAGFQEDEENRRKLNEDQRRYDQTFRINEEQRGMNNIMARQNQDLNLGQAGMSRLDWLLKQYQDFSGGI